MTVALYARRKAWPLEQVIVRLRHSRIHAADCAECETKAGRLDRVEWTVQFSGTLTAAQRARLLEIAQMCPVHRTLRSEVHIPAPGVVEDDIQEHLTCITAVQREASRWKLQRVRVPSRVLAYPDLIRRRTACPHQGDGNGYPRSNPLRNRSREG